MPSFDATAALGKVTTPAGSGGAVGAGEKGPMASARAGDGEAKERAPDAKATGARYRALRTGRDSDTVALV